MNDRIPPRGLIETLDKKTFIIKRNGIHIKSGAFGKVYEAYGPSGRKYAVKCLHYWSCDRDIAAYHTEEENLMKAKVNGGNQWIVELCGSHILEDRRFGYLIFELLSTTLSDAVREPRTVFSLADVRHLGAQLLHGVNFLHANNIVHTDIKTPNIVFTDDSFTTLKIIDLGSSCTKERMREYTEETELTTVTYRAPEILLGLPKDERIDEWSLGCVLAETYMGHDMLEVFHSYQLAEVLFNMGLLPANASDGAHTWRSFAIKPNGEVRLFDEGEKCRRNLPTSPVKHSFSSVDDVIQCSKPMWLNARAVGYNPRPTINPNYVMTQEESNFLQVLKALLHPDLKYRSSSARVLRMAFFE